MKKTLTILAIILYIFGTTVIATNDNIQSNETKTTTTLESKNTEKVVQDDKSTTSKLAEQKQNEKKKLEDYQASYGESYGVAAYVLSIIQIYSIPFCFIGIAISAIYQYVLGIRKLDVRDKGFTIMISIITLFIIAQVLPLIFAIVVKGWRG